MSLILLEQVRSLPITRPPAKRRKEARPHEILAAAVAEFDEIGFGRSTMAGIAKRAGISRTTIYLYFDTKEAILEAVIHNSVGRAIDAVAQIVETYDRGFTEVFKSVLDVLYDRFVSGDAAIYLKVLIAEGQFMPDLVRFYRNEILSKGEAVIRALIERGIATGELSVSCRNDDMRLLVSPAISAAIWMRVFGQFDPLDLEDFKAQHARMVCDALLARA